MVTEEIFPVYHTILVPLDGSPLAERAIPFAVTLAAHSAAHLLLLRVVEPGPQVGAGAVARTTSGPDEHVLMAEDYLAMVKAEIAVRQGLVDVVTVTEYGDPAACLASTAKRLAAEMIVMSTHGRSGLGRWLHGSIAARCCGRPACRFS
jgi:nucleotide-binding universal stress UspA family protein